MANYFIGNSFVNGDTGAGSGEIRPAMDVEWFDQGSLGLAAPFNAKIKADMVLGGTLRRGHSLVPGALTTSVTMTGTFRLDARLSRANIFPAIVLTASLHADLSFSGQIITSVFLDADMVVEAYPMLTREYYALRDGTRPSLPWLVYGADVTHYSQIRIGSTWQRELDEPFLIDGGVDLTADPILLDMGGKPNWIGLLLLVEINGVTLTAARFRAPELNEVIVRQTGEVLRWDGAEWTAYSTLPQRSLDGQLVFQLFDEAGLYDYYAKVLGLALAEWSYDTEHLRTFTDPVTCPDALVSLLADNFGLAVVNETPVDRKREFIRQFVLLQKEKGVDQSFRDALRVLGYTGYVRNVWVIPGGGPGDYIEKPIGYDNDVPTTYFPASQVSVHLNDIDGEPFVSIDEGVRQDVAEFLTRYLLPAHVRVRFFATDVQANPADDVVTLSDSFTIADI